MSESERDSVSGFVFAGIRFYSGRPEGVVSYVNDCIDRRMRTHICVTGVHGVVSSQKDNNVLRAHTAAGLVVPDGMPLVWAGKLSGHPETQRVYGPDLMRLLCYTAQEKHHRIYLYGTTQKTLRALAAELHRLYPGLIICGAYAPPFGPVSEPETQEVIRSINASGARIVFIGLSTPKQELWMHGMRNKLNANVLIGVGAAFDFISGTRQQAPSWVRAIGAEWLFRLVYEPGRLWKRYKVMIRVFPGLLFRHFFRV